VRTKTMLGTRFAKKPLELDIPITIAGMSFGALSANVKEALGAPPPRWAPRPPPATAA
jgi:glutamate synthase domain-containing protein 2